MLEFLGLETDALKVFACFLIIGAAFAPAIGILTGNKNSKAAPVLFGIAIVVSIISLFVSAGAIFMLFITFQWKWLILPFLAATVLCVILSLFFRSITIAARKAKYKKNPVVREIADYCKKNNIAGVQCLTDGVRFFTYLPNAAYCKSEIIRNEAKNDIMIANFKNNDFRPDYWKEYDSTDAICGYMKFSDKGYPNLEDVSMFARAVASRIGRCKIASHDAMYEYTKYYSKYQTSNGVALNERNIIHIHRDCLVYTKAALASAKKQKKAEVKAAPKPPKTNTWE